MNRINKKLDGLAQQFKTDKTPEGLKEIFNELHDLDSKFDVTHLEKIVILINQCIVLDALNEECIAVQGKRCFRTNILEQIKTFYEEFVSSAIVDKLEDNSTLSFKEQVSYLIALLLYKVHNYTEAYTYFRESKKFSERITNFENSNGLNSIRRIQRDIHFAYCCEYIGTPEMNCGKLVMSLRTLLGSRKEELDADEYWRKFKEYCYNNIDDLEDILANQKTKEEKALELIRLLLKFSQDEECVFSKLAIMCEERENSEEEYNEALHVLAHCLNELNMFYSNQELPIDNIQTDEEVIEVLKQKNLIKMIARVCIDSLGNRYGTCQASIRAEQGNGVDAILRMHSMDTRELSECDCAELDFYQYYFESMFGYHIHDNEHVHGKNFLEFCKKKSISNQDNYQDGLLHYYVVLLRNELKNFLGEIIYCQDKNEALFYESKQIQNSKCFAAYEELRMHEFSAFVNSQIVFEREKLIAIYKILRILQDNKLPLFYAKENFDKKIQLSESIEELFDLCKKFNSYTKETNFSNKNVANSCHACRKNKKCSKSEAETTEKDLALQEKESKNGIPFLVDGLAFEFYGNVNKFEGYLERCSISNYSFIENDECNKSRINPKNKILYYDNEEDLYECCSQFYEDMQKGARYHIFYVGQYEEEFAYRTIAMFDSIDICFLMAYVYGTIEHIINSIFHPKPIYILAPLRNVSSYEFQEAEFDSLVLFPDNYIHSIEVKSGGVGIKYQKEKLEEDYFNVSFLNEDIKEACISIVKLYNNKLYVLRNNKLVRKNVHIGLVNKMYDEYAAARKLAEKKRHNDSSKCSEEFKQISSCAYFYKRISDDVDFSRKNCRAATKLLHLLHIACEEEITSIFEHYILQSSFVEDSRIEGDGFQICIFDKNIVSFMGNTTCLCEVVEITKLNRILSENIKEKAFGYQNLSEKEDMMYLVKSIDKCIEACNDKIRNYKYKHYEESLKKMRLLKENAIRLKEKAINDNKVDITQLENELEELREDFNKIVK